MTAKTAQDIIDTFARDLRLDPATLTIDSWKRIAACLEDGEALEALGITDDDQEAVEEAHDAAKREIRELALSAAPGYASEVWGGWVWMVGSDEMSWSKRATRESCERAVEQAINLHGVDGAFAS